MLHKRRGKAWVWAVMAVIIFTQIIVPGAQASRIEKQEGMSVQGDFDLGPTQYDFEVSPGETVKVSPPLQLTNRKGAEQDYELTVEDFEGSTDNPETTVALQGEEAGQFGAKNWFTLELTKATLQHADRLFFDVTINIPWDAEPGDHYATVLVKGLPIAGSVEENANVRLSSRVGALFFITVKGDVKKEGTLKSFSTNHPWFKKGPVDFQYVFENTGTVRLRPSGNITVRNMIGRKKADLPIKEYNVLRNSVRGMGSKWDKTWLLGRYSATIELKKGFGDETEKKTIYFWVLPWQQLLVLLGILIGFIIILSIAKKFVRLEVGARKK